MTRTTATPDNSGKKHTGRIEFIDLLRGWAVVVMIETHVFNATLASDLLSGSAFQYLKFINGLVAPSFLFASGLAYAVTTRRKAQEYLSLGKPLMSQLGRILTIALIGYLLHIPIFSARHLFTEATDEQWQSFFQVDVLQCIAVSLLLLQALLLALRSERRQYGAALLLSILAVAATPFVWEINFWSQIPWIFAGYMNGIKYSLFPLFPWMAFLFAGAVAGYLFTEAREKARSGAEPQAEKSALQSLVWTGGSLILAAFLLEHLFPAMRERPNYWSVSPAFFLLRLGIVMILCSALAHWTLLVPSSGKPVIRLFGRESLLIYVAHLLLLFGSFGSFKLTRKVGGTFGYTEASLLTLFFILLMFGSAFVWSNVKKTSPFWTRAATVSTIVVAAVSFLLGDG